MNCGSDSFLRNEIDQSFEAQCTSNTSFEIDSDNGNPSQASKRKPFRACERLRRPVSW